MLNIYKQFLKIFRKSTTIKVFISILFSGFLYTLAGMLFFTRNILLIRLVITLIPCAVTFLVAFFYEKNKLKKIDAILISSFVFSISAFALFINLFLMVGLTYPLIQQIM